MPEYHHSRKNCVSLEPSVECKIYTNKNKKKSRLKQMHTKQFDKLKKRKKIAKLRHGQGNIPYYIVEFDMISRVEYVLE